MLLLMGTSPNSLAHTHGGVMVGVLDVVGLLGEMTDY